MTFKKNFLLWLVITGLAGGIFYLIKTMFHGHPLWAWAVPVLYVGVLILFVIYLLSCQGEKKV